MTDLALLSLVSFIFENKTVKETDSDLQQASRMLRDAGHMTLDVDTSRPIVVDTSAGYTSVLVSTLNKYQPEIAVSFHVADPAGAKELSELSVQGVSRHTYSKAFPSPLALPRLHGGELFLHGDVEAQSILDSINSSPFHAVMTSFVVIEGTVRSSTDQLFDAIVTSIKSKLQLTARESMFGFFLVASSDHSLKYHKDVTVRSWKITCTCSQGELVIRVFNVLRA